MCDEGGVFYMCVYVLYLYINILTGADCPDVQQVRAGAAPGVKSRSESGSCGLCRDVCLCGASRYKNVLNAIVEDGRPQC